MEASDKVYIPMRQHIGAPSKPLVKKGDKVKAGSLVAQASGFVSANIHSSVSGEVEGFEMREDISGKRLSILSSRTTSITKKRICQFCRTRLRKRLSKG